MHEYSIAQSLLARVEQEARARHATAVHRLAVRIGRLSGVEPELLRSAYDLVRERTICAGAVLEIEPVEVLWVCPRCGEKLAPAAILRCPLCQIPARLEAGDEIILERIELEVP
jgi:hydrogenase nickel incorporation protein HypA/HybF